MADFRAPSRLADKYDRLKSAYDCLAGMNAELIGLFKRQHEEVTALVARNEEVLRRCDEFFAAEPVGANGNGNGSRANN